MNNPWEDLTPPAESLAARRVDSRHPLDLFWARDGAGRYAFVYEFDLGQAAHPPSLPEFGGLSSEFHRVSRAPDRCRLTLALRDEDGWEMFLALCRDLTLTTSTVVRGPEATQTLVRRLEQWQELLRAGRGQLLSEARLKGLLGELLFLLRVLLPTFPPADCIFFWQGPEDLPQDFNVGDAAIEVKCQQGTSAPRVHISSAEQLSTQLAELYLHVITLGKCEVDAPEALTLPGVISDIWSKLGEASPLARERFSRLLLEYGYVENVAYSEISFILSSEQTFAVRDGFPRICPTDLPMGVTSVSYSIDLKECAAFAGSPSWMTR